MIKKIIVSALLLATSACYSERCIQPTKYSDQEEILKNGGVMLMSSKTNEVLIYQTQEALKRGRGNFFFNVTNYSDKKINLYTNNVRVTDQCGRPLRIVPKRELIKNKKKDTNWQLFSSGLIECMDASNANRAGDTTYCENSYTNARTRYHHHGRRCETGAVDTAVSSTTYGTVHNEAERQRALREVRREAFFRDQAILNQQAHFEQGMQDNYFDSETIYPDEMYSANVQIEVPKNLLNELQFVLFHFDLGEEEHTFAFYIGADY